MDFILYPIRLLYFSECIYFCFSDHETAKSSISEDKHAIEPSWGPTFDRSDDTYSVWSYNPNVKNSGPSFDRSDDTDSVWSYNPKVKKL